MHLRITFSLSADRKLTGLKGILCKGMFRVHTSFFFFLNTSEACERLPQAIFTQFVKTNKTFLALMD